MAPRRVDKAARREEILAAAVRVFARKGFAASRIDDVAAEAGIGKGSVYLYFDSREALLDAAFENMTAAAEDILRRARSSPGPALDRLAVLIGEVLRTVSAEPDLARILLDLWNAGRGGAEGLPLSMAAVYAQYRTVIADLLREAGKEGTARPGLGLAEATVIVGAIEGCLLQWVIDPQVPIADLTGPIVAVCLDGVRAHGRPDRSAGGRP